MDDHDRKGEIRRQEVPVPGQAVREQPPHEDADTEQSDVSDGTILRLLLSLAPSRREERGEEEHTRTTPVAPVLGRSVPLAPPAVPRGFVDPAPSAKRAYHVERVAERKVALEAGALEHARW